MGWHYILHVTCKLLPEFQEFVEKKYLKLFSEYDNYTSSDDEQNSKTAYEEEQTRERKNAYTYMSKTYKDLIDIWTDLDICHFYKYELNGSTFQFEICKKVNTHHRDLKQDYEAFLRDILVPITSEITYCEIESDDYGDARYRYTDTELRRITFNLRDQIKSIEHTYNEDRTEILESRVVYKRSIKKLQFLDLERAYKGY